MADRRPKESDRSPGEIEFYVGIFKSIEVEKGPEMKKINFLRRGQGSPLLLVHGLGGSSESWCPFLNLLTQNRDVIAIDLPGFGASPPLDGEVSISTLADAVENFLIANDLTGIDAVGSSTGATLVLELARRGNILGSVVALSPGGFWRGLERHAFYASIFATIRIVRAIHPVMTDIAKSKVARTVFLSQFSAHPWKLEARTVLTEMRNYHDAVSFDELLKSLAYGEKQKGAEFGSLDSPLVIGWGRQDRISFPREAQRALELFPDAKLRWFDHCGHFPQWDAPEETAQLILDNTGVGSRAFSRRRAKETKPEADHVKSSSKTHARVRSRPHDLPAL